jgi:ADP-ribose pyrophosphatase YjhB (NUDIX family)
MVEPKLGKSSSGKDMHYSVGAIIYRDGKLLLVDRLKVPLGLAGPAGHVDVGETPEHALVREVKEETYLDAARYEKVSEEEVDGNMCARGIDVHYWHVYRCETTGEPIMKPDEAKSIGWYSPEQIKELKEKRKLEPVWEHWFEVLGIVK